MSSRSLNKHTKEACTFNPAMCAQDVEREYYFDATLLIPIDLFLILLVEEFYGTRYQSGSLSLM